MFTEIEENKETEEKESKIPQKTKGIPYDPYILTNHHRLPKSLNGGDSPRNISRVHLYKHKAWHDLYRDLNATAIFSLFSGDRELQGLSMMQSSFIKKIIKEYSTRKNKRRARAFNTLFGKKSLEEVLRDINTLWLDPDCTIEVAVTRIKTICFEKTDISSTSVIEQPPTEQEAWSYLYGNLPTENSLALFFDDNELRTTEIKRSDSLQRVLESYANDSREKTVRTRCWNTLFANKTIEQRVQTVNTFLFNKGYTAVIGTKRIKTLHLSETKQPYIKEKRYNYQLQYQ